MEPGTAIKTVIRTRSIDGWFNQGAAYLFALLDEIQKQEGITGDLFEIGVHHGRSAVLLGMMVDPAQERLGVCDLFEQESDNISGSGLGDRAIFEKNMQRFFGDLSFMRIHASSSLLLTDSDIGTRSRFFHIDGGHSAEETLADLRLASETILPDGVVILDDVFSPMWPGVVEGLFRFMDSLPGRLAPIAIGFNKLVLTPPSSTIRYLDRLSDREWFDRYFAPMPCSTFESTFLGHQVQIFHTTAWAVTDSVKARFYRSVKSIPRLAAIARILRQR